jgi:hypothetical protein
MAFQKQIGLLVTFALGLLLAPLAAEAQPVAKIPRIGVLSAGFSPGSADPAAFEAFRQGLRTLGYVEGQTIVVEYRWAEGQENRLPDLAAELVGLHVDLIVAGTTRAVQAAQHATRTIPIVMGRQRRSGGLGLRRQPSAARGEHHRDESYGPGGEWETAGVAAGHPARRLARGRPLESGPTGQQDRPTRIGRRRAVLGAPAIPPGGAQC